MSSLSSSAEDRIRRLQSDLVLSVCQRRGAFWKAIHGIRERWRIEAQVQLPPPTSTGGYYTPPSFPEKPQVGDAGYEKWAGLLSQWNGELLDLHRRFVPEDYREPVRPDI